MEIQSIARRVFIAAAVLVVLSGIVPSSARAGGSGKCTFFAKADAERALGGPVVFLPSQMDATNCAWGRAKDPSVGVTVSREARSDWYPPKPNTPGVSKIRHVAGVGQDAYTYYANAGAGGVYTADILSAKGVTSVSLSEAAGDGAKALAIARSMMNR